MLLRGITVLILMVTLTLVLPAPSYGKCKSSFINPITDICWQCLFPLVVGGVKLINSDIKPTLDAGVESPICVCRHDNSMVLGLRSGFFEPSRLVETVKDPFCFPILGTGFEKDLEHLGGSASESSESPESGEAEDSTFAQAHWFIFPAFALVDLFVDFPCFEESSFGLAYFTEIDPMWNDDLRALIIFPETILFANPIAPLSCVADSIATSIAGKPINVLFWCMGSWGTTYPMSGHFPDSNVTESNAALAAKMIYKLGREMLHFDKGTDVCGAVKAPIWKKNHYRMHIMKPVRDKTCHPVGKSSILWASGKNPPWGAGGNAPDNFAWMIFMKNICCVGYKFP